MPPMPPTEEGSMTRDASDVGGTTYSTYELRITGVRSDDGTRRW